MCDDSDCVLGQRIDTKLVVIYYVSMTLGAAQVNYSTTLKEFFATIFSLEKFQLYLFGSGSSYSPIIVP